MERAGARIRRVFWRFVSSIGLLLSFLWAHGKLTISFTLTWISELDWTIVWLLLMSYSLFNVALTFCSFLLATPAFLQVRHIISIE